jgi:hypothetical protein
MGKGSGGGSGPGFYLRGGDASSSAHRSPLNVSMGASAPDPMCQHSTQTNLKDHDKTQKAVGRPKGLLNVGNSCYANSVLQCLLSTALTHALIDPKASAIFRRYSSNPNLLEQGSGSVDSNDPRPRQQLLHDRKMQENCQWLTQELKAITMIYQSERPNEQQHPTLNWFRPAPHIVVDPGSITKHPDRLSTCLRPYQQEDAHEFLRALLSTLVMNGQNKELSSLFDGLLESAVTCLSCRRPSLTRDRYMDLSLDILNCDTLTAALDDFTATETLSGDNQVFCQACDCKRNATKGLRLATAPSILVTHLKRFAFDTYGQLVRVSKHVAFPLTLEIGDYMSRVNKARPPPYELVAVLVHQGATCEAGHYLAYVKNNGLWYKCNDSDVSVVDVSVVLSQQAYILVYEVEEMRSKNGYASPSGVCKGVCGGNLKEKPFWDILSSSFCGVDDGFLSDFCCSNTTSIPQAPVTRRRRRRASSVQRATDSSSHDIFDDMSTIGESTVDTAYSEKSKVLFRRSASSGNLKTLDRSRDTISHSTGRAHQHYFGGSEVADALPDYRTAQKWAARSKVSKNRRELPPRVPPSDSHRRTSTGNRKAVFTYKD